LLNGDCIDIIKNGRIEGSTILLHLEHLFVFKKKCLTAISSGALEFTPGV